MAVAHVQTGARATRRGRLRRGWSTPYLFILPFAVLFIVFFIVPILYAVEQSLYRAQRSGLGLGGPPTVVFNGLNNFRDVFTDGAFWEGLGRVVLYGVVQVPVMLGLALILALLLDSTVVRFKAFFRLAFFVPFAVPGVIAAILWGYLYNPDVSPIVKGLHALGSTVDLLGPNTILWSIANVVTWVWTGYNMLILYSALQAIPSEIYEAARIDGCTGLGIARYIKIPLVAPALVLTCVLSIIGTLQLFNEPQVFKGFSNNISSTFTPNIYAYNTAFGSNDYYYAAALAVVLALFTFVLSFGFLRLTRQQSGV